MLVALSLNLGFYGLAAFLSVLGAGATSYPSLRANKFLYCSNGSHWVFVSYNQ